MSSSVFGGLFGRPTLGDYQALPDVAPDWMWTADIINVGSLLPLQNIYVREINFGFNFYDYEQRYRNGIYYTFPRHAQTHPVSVVFYEPQNFLVTQYLNSWRLKIRNNKGQYGIPNQYLGGIIFRSYDYTGLLQLVVKISGCWPLAQQPIMYQYSQSGPVTTACDFSINNVEILYSGGIIGTLLGQGASGLSGINLIGNAVSAVQTGQSLVQLF